MSHGNETLQDLLERRLRDLGHRRGRGENLSLREAWLRLPERPGGGRAISYETVRRIRENGHYNISDDTADAIATMLGVGVDEVLEAAGRRRRLGRFELPRRADRLTERERKAVLGVVDAILDAAEQSGEAGREDGREDRLRGERGSGAAPRSAQGTAQGSAQGSGSRSAPRVQKRAARRGRPDA